VEQTFLESSARLLVVLHAAGAIVLIGASTHHSLITLGYLRGRHKRRLGRIYAATVAGAYAVTFVLGALAYPAFRYHVRGLYLDRHAPWASNLFDIKENFAALGLPLVLGALVLSRVMDPKVDRGMLVGYAVMVFLSTAIVWFSVFSGLLITLVKGV
jgi:hypothetical protein